jgi:ribonuclease P protein component
VDQRFPKAHRLTRRAEFLRVQEQGKKVAAGVLLALVLPNDLGHARLGVTVSSKVGNAVVRAALRRRLRETFRKRRGELPAGIDLVLIARSSAKGAESAELGRAFETIATRLRSVFP